MENPQQISISDYDYFLPEEKIALFPAQKRDASNLLIYKNETISRDTFYNLGNHLPPNAHLVFNNTKVIYARLRFVSQQNRVIEIFCLEPFEDHNPGTALSRPSPARWYCLVGQLKRWKDGALQLRAGDLLLKAKLINKGNDKQLVEFEWQPAELNFSEVLERAGEIPIPPYIKRESDERDKITYQTVYSSIRGSVAAPTAGLHFTDGLLKQLIAGGIKAHSLTLHVGAGTFKPVKSALLANHQMHSEQLQIDFNTLEALSQAKGPLVAVGTTSLRSLESLYWMGFKVMQNPGVSAPQLNIEQWEPYTYSQTTISAHECFAALGQWMKKQGINTLNASTGILIAPPYTLKTADALLTNFHQPRSTLLLLVAACIGEPWKRVYDYALHNNFRFLSYGDSSLLFIQK